MAFPSNSHCSGRHLAGDLSTTGSADAFCHDQSITVSSWPAPALTSAQYTSDFNEVKAIGRFDSALRTPVQTQLALLWQAAGLVDENRIARSAVPSANSLVDNARLFALLNIAACDALIAGFDSKFAYNLWRPYHAIRLADTDGNADTTADPAWNSLFLAPRFQEYIYNLASLPGPLMHVLACERAH